jgi:cytochrome c oxidase cbb3-type subunit 3
VKKPGTLFVLVLGSLWATGCDPTDKLPGKPRPEDSPVAANEVVRFDILYSMRCAGCHGADGKLGPAPPLNDPLFRAIVSEKELVDVIASGRKVTLKQKTPMPAFASDQGGPLTTAQVKALAKGIKEHWGAPSVRDGDLPPYQGASGGGKKEEGARVLFASACAGCHGSEGQGNREGPWKAGALKEQAFLALITDQALRRIVITGRPDLGMPAFDGKEGRPEGFKPLTSAEIDDVVALLATWRQGGSADGK